MTRHFLPLIIVSGALTIAGSLHAAQTLDPTPMSQTLIVLKLDSDKPVEIRSSSTEQPPKITIEFPPQRVIGSLPEHSVVQQGAVRAITTHYADAASSTRFIQSLELQLSAPYAYQARSEPGRVVIAIEHPASVSSVAMEVGLHGGTISGFTRRGVDERFRAMQAALANATPIQWALPASPRPSAPAAVVPTPPSAAAAVFASSGRANPAGLWLLFAASVAAGAWGVWSLHGPAGWRIVSGWSEQFQETTRWAAGIALIDQLVWKAFERQGYQMVRSVERSQLPGPLRVIAKDGAETALLCAGNGVFFEKQAVERFVRAIHAQGLSQGILVATGAFTVPAQRIAKQHGIILIGREQLVELIGAGAASEYVAQQLEQSRVHLEEAQGQLRQYTSELETLRKQRNEATWQLGDERAKSGMLQVQLDGIGQQLRQYEMEIRRWEQDSSVLRAQWEESQWYLGESRERVRHLEAQLAAAQEVHAKRQAAEQERDGLQRALGALQEEFSMVLAHGERRRAARVHLPDASVEISDGKGKALGSGRLANISRTGLRLETDSELSSQPLRLRLTLPGVEHPIDAKARLVWQKADGAARYRSGCRLTGLPAASRARMSALIEQQRA